jgi:hypothetical protein
MVCTRYHHFVIRELDLDQRGSRSPFNSQMDCIARTNNCMATLDVMARGYNRIR